MGGRSKEVRKSLIPWTKDRGPLTFSWQNPPPSFRLILPEKSPPYRINFLVADQFGKQGVSKTGRKEEVQVRLDHPCNGITSALGAPVT